MKRSVPGSNTQGHAPATRTCFHHLCAKHGNGTVVFCLLLSTAIRGAADYSFKIVAQTGQNGIVSIGQSVSINDSGLVAFTAKTADGTYVFVGDGSSPLQSLPADRASEVVQINNDSQVLVDRGTYITSADPVWYYPPFGAPILISPGYSDAYGFLLLLDATDSSSIQTVAEYDLRETSTRGPVVGSIGPLAQGPFSYIGPGLSVNNYGGSVFMADTSTGLNPTYVMATPGSGGTFNTTPMWLGAEPMIADNGQIVVRKGPSPTDPIVVYPQNLATPALIASSADGFTALGAAPGISDDGQYVAFYGDLSVAGAAKLQTTPGPGIFIFLQEPAAGELSIQRIAGLTAPDGTVQFSGFDNSARVAVNTNT